MANAPFFPGTINAPFGVRPVRQLRGGGTPERGGQGYTIANGYAAAIGLFDIVKTIDTFQQNAGNGGTLISGPEINIAATGGTPIGVFDGCNYQDPLGNFIWSKNWVASTSTFNAAGAQAFVFDDPEIVFQVQASAALTNGNIGQFATFLSNGVPNTLGVSTTTLNAGGTGTSITDFKILNVVIAAGLQNVPTALFPIVEVLLAKHELRDPISNG